MELHNYSQPPSSGGSSHATRPPQLPPFTGAHQPPSHSTSYNSDGSALPLTPKSGGSFFHSRRPSKPSLPPLSCISAAALPTTPGTSSTFPGTPSFASHHLPPQPSPVYPQSASLPAPRAAHPPPSPYGTLADHGTSHHPYPARPVRTAPLFPSNSPMTPGYAPYGSSSVPNTPGHPGAPLHSPYPPSAFNYRRPSPVPEDGHTVPTPPGHSKSLPSAPGLYDDQVNKFRVHTIDGHAIAHRSPKHGAELRRAYELCQAVLQFSSHYMEALAKQSQPQPTLEAIDDMVQRSSDILQIFVDIRNDLSRPQSEDEAMQYIRNKRTMLAPTRAKYRKRTRKSGLATPGRCHSCNISETPEWRRGPDGARTLCNACGLHYAKLTKKRAQEAAKLLESSDLASAQAKAEGADGGSATPAYDGKDLVAISALITKPVTMEEVKAAAHGERVTSKHSLAYPPSATAHSYDPSSTYSTGQRRSPSASSNGTGGASRRPLARAGERSPMSDHQPSPSSPYRSYPSPHLVARGSDPAGPQPVQRFPTLPSPCSNYSRPDSPHRPAHLSSPRLPESATTTGNTGKALVPTTIGPMASTTSYSQPMHPASSSHVAINEAAAPIPANALPSPTPAP